MGEQSHDRREPAGRLVHSYRQVFRFDTRLYKFDRWSIPVRGGVEVRLLVYAVVIYLLLAIARSVAPFAALQDMLPAPFAWLILPLGAAFLLSRFRPDGRVPHHAAFSMVRWLLSPRRLAGLRVEPGVGRAMLAETKVVLLDDWRSGHHVPEGVIQGPATVLVRRRAELRRAGKGKGAIAVDGDAPATARGKRVQVPAGGMLTIRDLERSPR